MKLRKTRNPLGTSPLLLLLLQLKKEEEITETGSVKEREELAKTTSIPDIQLILLKDKSSRVRDALIQNPNLHKEIINLLKRQ